VERAIGEVGRVRRKIRRDFSSELRVTPKASDAEIKSAFRHLAKTCHPDVKPDDRSAEEAFQEVTRAYQVLSNPETRKVYDAFLASRRAAARLRLRRSLATMSTTFLLTAAAAVGAVLWIGEGGLSSSEGGRVLGGVAERGATVEVARAAAAEPAQEAKSGADPRPGRGQTVRGTPVGP
jgi:curved DNA-binding protein CbpA